MFNRFGEKKKKKKKKPFCVETTVSLFRLVRRGRPFVCRSHNINFLITYVSIRFLLFFFLHSKPFNPRFPSRPTTTIVRARYPTPARPHIRGVRSLNCHRGFISSSSTTDTRETRGIYNNTLYYYRAIYIHVIRDRRTILQTAIMRIRRRLTLKYYHGRIRKPIHNRWFPNGYRILAF